MITFPNAKINLGLRIHNRRSDGFHNIETLIYPIGLCDALEIVPADEFGFCFTGLDIEGDQDNNICIKAYKLMHQRYGLAPVYIHLHKVIPTGAGLGGGSADAVFTLKLLMRVFKLEFCGSELDEMAKMLGSDCNFFVNNQPALCTGRGEVVNPVGFSLKGWHLLLVKPPFNISTASAYASVEPSGKALRTDNNFLLATDQWKDWMINDFEAGLIEKYPILSEIREKLFSLGATQVSLSGSGSAMFGLFKDKPESTDVFRDMFVWEEKLI
jgi:4-diphosphocytidyl-2-C-methyl-D-erythritol kinase